MTSSVRILLFCLFGLFSTFVAAQAGNDHGTAGDAWEKGLADIGGTVAINPSGGLKAKGHPIGATGAGQVFEVVNQLRGEVEPGRQVPDAKIGMTDTLGGDGGTLVNMLFEKGW